MHEDHLRTSPAPAQDAPERSVGWLSAYARRRKLDFFFGELAKDAEVLDVGCADGWVREWVAARGWNRVLGIDLEPPADVVGDVNEWSALGLQPASFDAIVAFEVVEHGDFAASLRCLLKPDGLLLVTTPVPRMDWACQLMEAAGMLQRRTSEHSHLVDLRRYPGFRVVDRRVKGLVSQWAVLTPA